MTLSTSVEDSLNEAESHLRNALAFAARTERPMVCSEVCSEVAKLISRIQTIVDTNNLLDNLDERKEGSSGLYGNFFNPEDEEE